MEPKAENTASETEKTTTSYLGPNILDFTSLRVYGKKFSLVYSGPTTVHPKQQPMRLLIDSHMAKTP